jgi:hypothetical protein
MTHLQGFRRFTSNRKPSLAMIMTNAYVNAKQDLPTGYGNWIFTNPECAPFELEGYYSTVSERARHHFKNEGKAFCFLSPNSTKIKRTNVKSNQ